MKPTLIPELEHELVEAAERRSRPRRRFARRGTIAVVAAVLIAAGGAAAVVGTRDSADPRVKAELSILRRPVVPSDALPQGFIRRQREFEPVSGVKDRIVYEQARRVRTVMPRWKAWMAPAEPNGSACLLVQPPEAAGPGSGSCFRVEDIDSGADPATTGGYGRVTAQGIVPDGVDHVTVERSDGTRFDVPVRDNVYIAVSTTHSTAKVKYDGPHGPVTLDAWSPGYVPAPPKPSAADQRESDRARREPSKRRPAHAGPVVQMRGQPGSNVGGRRTLYYVTWRARITGGAYAYRLRGPAGRGCRSRQSHWLGNQRHKYSRRGHILSVTLSPPGKLYRRSGITDGPTPQAWCPGTYKVDIAWVGHGRRYPPFATATFVVR